MKRLPILILSALILLLPCMAGAADYNWYFADAGNDTTGDGTEGDPWKTLSKVQTQINATTSSDTAAFNFNRGDTWTFGSGTPILTFNAADATITFTAYGAGALPIFDGEVDFASPPAGRNFYDSFIWVKKAGCTIEYVEFKRGYGQFLHVYAGSLTVQHCTIHDFGWAAIHTNSTSTVTDCVIQNNEIYNGVELWRTGVFGWPSVLNFRPGVNNTDNTFRYNKIYNICGEGIHLAGGTVEYNLFWNMYSAYIYADPKNNDGDETIIRYNLCFGVLPTDYGGEGGYARASLGGRLWNAPGITVNDEGASGDNSNWNVEIYGNTVIGTMYGIQLYYTVDVADNCPSLKIHNNTIIDCYTNIYVDAGDQAKFDSVYLYNNSSIKYDMSGEGIHCSAVSDGGWDIDNNHFWKTGGSPSVPTGWSTNNVVTDPKLPGEPGVNWDGLTTGTDIDFDTHLYPPSDSALVDNGKTLSSPYQTLFLSTGTDYNDLPSTATFELLAQGDYGAGWDIGAIIYQSPSEDPPIGNNDFSTDPDCIGWWRFEGNALDSKGSDDLGNIGNPTYTAANGDRGVILDGDDALNLADLTSDVTDDLTVYVKFKFDAELADNTGAILASEWDLGNDQACWAVWIYDDSGGGGEDEIMFSHGTAPGDAQTLVYDTSFDLVHGTVYSAIITYDDTNDDVHIWIYDIDGSNRLDSTDNDGTVAADINTESVEFNIGRSAAGSKYFTGTIYEVAILTVEKSEADALLMATGAYSGSAITVTDMVSVSSNLTAAGEQLWAIGWDREPFTEGGAWTIDVDFDYPTTTQTMGYVGKWNPDGSANWEVYGDYIKKLTYIEPTTVWNGILELTEDDGDYESLDSNEWDWDANYLYVNVAVVMAIKVTPWETYVSIDVEDGWRQGGFGDGEIGPDIDLVGGTVTITDAQAVNAVVIGVLTGLGTYPANTVANPGQWILSSGYDFDNWLDFDTAIYSIPGDEFIVNFTGNLNTDSSGTRKNMISITGLITGDAIFDEDYWSLVDLNVTGSMNMSGKYITVE